jgi:hypothetical protein
MSKRKELILKTPQQLTLSSTDKDVDIKWITLSSCCSVSTATVEGTQKEVDVSKVGGTVAKVGSLVVAS